MSTFGSFKLVNVRKIHRCVTCQRLIPQGKMAYHQGGMWEGDWQNWYMCKPCNDNGVVEGGCEISDEDFYWWVDNNISCPCPICQEKDSDWDWNEDNTSLVFTCNICDAVWEKFIGFGEKT